MKKKSTTGNRQTYRQVRRQAERPNGQTVTQVDIHTDSQTDRQTDSDTSRHTNTHTCVGRVIITRSSVIVSEPAVATSSRERNPPIEESLALQQRKMYRQKLEYRTRLI